MTVQFDACDGRSVHQWYVMAEGPVAFTDDDPEPHILRIYAKDRGEEHAAEWSAGGPQPYDRVAELVPAKMSGYESRESLDDRDA